MSNGQDPNVEILGEDGGPLRTGFISNATFINRQVEFAIIDSLAVFEGDIILGRADEVPATPPVVTEGLGIVGARYRWPDRTVPYEIDSGLPNAERVTEAADHWNSSTVLRFVARTNEPDYIDFKWHASGCSSYVGRQGGPQVINLADWGTTGNTAHEMGHAIGLWHEHSREDRDRHVTIMWDNIQSRAMHNFYQHISDGDDIGPYDYDSLMHYGAYGFAIDRSKPTIESPEPIGQREALSTGDIAAVAAMYA
jgi:Astacin (Peptidase family M12A)